MSESNGKVHEIPAADKFRVRGEEFDIDAAEASSAFQEILKGLPPEATQKTYLDAVRAWVLEHGGPDLTLGEAEWLYQYVEVLRQEKRDFFRDALSGKRTLRSSSLDSTPSS